MGDPGSEIIECIPPAGPEASESTVEENEDDIQFVSEGPLRPVLEYIDLVSSDDDEPSTSQREDKHKDHIDHQKDKVALTLARLARHVEVEKQQKEEKNRAFRTMENDTRLKANSSDFLTRVQNGSLSSRDNSQHRQRIWPRNC